MTCYDQMTNQGWTDAALEAMRKALGREPDANERRALYRAGYPRRGELSPEEAADACLAGVHAHDPLR